MKGAIIFKEVCQSFDVNLGLGFLVLYVEDIHAVSDAYARITFREGICQHSSEHYVEQRWGLNGDLLDTVYDLKG